MNMFTGLRVLDVASFVAAPAAGTLLADWGANVIKVEPPQGETWRNVTPPNQVNAVWLLTSHNKKSIVVDIKKEEGRKLLHTLIKQCDILLLNLRPNQLQQYGLAYDMLSKLNPRLIHANVNGYGERGGTRRTAGPSIQPRGSPDAVFSICSEIKTRPHPGQSSGWAII